MKYNFITMPNIIVKDLEESHMNKNQFILI